MQNIKNYFVPPPPPPQSVPLQSAVAQERRAMFEARRIERMGLMDVTDDELESQIEPQQDQGFLSRWKRLYQPQGLAHFTSLLAIHPVPQRCLSFCSPLCFPFCTYASPTSLFSTAHPVSMRPPLLLHALLLVHS